MGSSAISKAGFSSVETTVTMRCFMPPESWWAYWSSTRVGISSIFQPVGRPVKRVRLRGAPVVGPHHVEDEVADPQRGS